MAQCFDTRLRSSARQAWRQQRRRHSAGLGSTVALVAGASLLVGSAPPVAATIDAGSWRPPEIIKADARANYYGKGVLSLPDGRTLAFWINRSNHLLFSSRPAEGDWSSPQDLTGAGSTVWVRRVIEDPHNEATMFWRGTIDGEEGIWSRRFVDQEWTAPRLEVVPDSAHAAELSVAKTGSATAVLWREDDSTSYRGVLKVAVQRGSDEWTTLPSLPMPNQFVMHLAIDRAGLPTVVGAVDGRVLATTYGLDGAWLEEQIGPRPRYKLANTTPPTVEGASNRDGALVVAWRETPVGEGGAYGRTVARVRPPGEAFGEPHALTSESSCYFYNRCMSLGVAADGDISAVYTSQPDDETDLWFTRRDAGSGAWSSPRQLASDLDRYFPEWAHSTARSGRSVVAIADETGHLVYRCRASGDCGSGTSLKRPGRNTNVHVDGAGPRAALLWGKDDLRARVFE